ncbi:hypothetical protein [Microbulbifer rhizosphaerae]|uniref:Uncharacterized protein n=1 Tax=Microbulbifer rhizosphaerae TaxID=1562603 RepID=A0A7W4WA26_9GAMM|nr:hypothetical protein [Microbulbifer rhizosphaerae]MBB3060436.1 hypothetical protein [Microbulbifer rhizosphaerae]
MNRTVILSAFLSLAISGCATQGDSWKISGDGHHTTDIHDIGNTPRERMLIEERNRKEKNNYFRDKDIIILLALMTAGTLVYDLLFDDKPETGSIGWL